MLVWALCSRGPCFCRNGSWPSASPKSGLVSVRTYSVVTQGAAHAGSQGRNSGTGLVSRNPSRQEGEPTKSITAPLWENLARLWLSLSTINRQLFHSARATIFEELRVRRHAHPTAKHACVRRVVSSRMPSRPLSLVSAAACYACPIWRQPLALTCLAGFVYC